jgi:hypothetical protein
MNRNAKKNVIADSNISQQQSQCMFPKTFDLKKLNIKTDYLSGKSLEKVDSSKIMSFLLSQL